MNKFLHAVQSRLTSGYQSALEKASVSPELQSSKLDINGLVSLIGDRTNSGFDPVFQHIDFLAGDVITEEQFTKSFLEIYTDLKGIYTQAAHGDYFVSKLKANLDSEKAFVTQAIRKLNETNVVLRYRNLDTDWNGVKIVSPQSSLNRYSQGNKAEVDVDAGSIHAEVISTSKYAQQRGPLRATIGTTWKTSDVVVSNPKSFRIENTLKPTDTTGWYAVASSDRETSTTWESTEYSGVLVEVKVTLPIANRINELRISPNAPVQMRLLDVKYRFGDKIASVPDFSPIDLNYETESIKFGRVDTTELRLYILQQNPRILDLLIPATDVHSKGVESMLVNYLEEERVSQTRTNIDRLNVAEELIDEVEMDQRDLRASTQRVFLRMTKDKDIVASSSQNVPGSEVTSEEFTNVRKAVYEFGIKTIQVNYSEYSPTSVFLSDNMIPNGSPMEIGMTTEVEEPSLGNSSVDVDKPYNILYDLELSDRASFPILDEGTTSIESELLKIDRESLEATTRFEFNSASLVVYKDGQVVPSAYYQAISSQSIRFDSSYRQLTANAVFVIDYDLATPFTWVDLATNNYEPIPTPPENFNGTEKDNFVELAGYPHVVRDIVLDTEFWQQTNGRDASYQYMPPQGLNLYSATNASHKAPVVELSGDFYGQYEASVVQDSGRGSTTNIEMNVDIPPAGVVQIGREIIQYDSVTGNRAINNPMRGVRNTTQVSHLPGTTATWLASPSYDPIEVFIDGAKAINLTDYREGRHGAFQERDGVVEFVQIGKKLYFSKPITSSITVLYKRWVDFVRIRATINCFGPFERDLSPSIKNLLIKTNSLVI